MTRVFGQLFADGRDGHLIVKPSKAFFGCSKHERQFDVSQGAIDFELQPTPPRIHYLIAFKDRGDFTRPEFTLKWVIPSLASYDVSPGANNTPEKTAPASPKPTVYERVQLKRVAGELIESLSDNEILENRLSQAQERVSDLENELSAYRRSTDLVLSERDKTIAQLHEQNAPVVKTVYLDKPVPPKALHERIQRLEQENKRLIELNAEYYKSVVELYQLQLDKARNTPPALPAESTSSPQQRLLRKLLGK
jgi:hypothetical protein|tara:strand:- start:60 stop:812 length:753 start_codon:yes stop_codon:yes gene_type:complete